MSKKRKSKSKKKKKKKTKITGFLIGIIIILIGGILLAVFQRPVLDFLHRPEVRLIEFHKDNVCPEKLSFIGSKERISSFVIKMQNIGEDGGMFFINSKSDNINIRKSNVAAFDSHAEKEFFIESKAEKDFNFEIQPKTEIKELPFFRISFDYGAYEKVLGIKVKSKGGACQCSYDLENIPDYKLVRESCQ